MNSDNNLNLNDVYKRTRVPIDTLIENVESGNVSRCAYIINIMEALSLMSLKDLGYTGENDLKNDTYKDVVKRLYLENGDNNFLLKLGAQLLDTSHTFLLNGRDCK
ncbi:MAG: hypothetical protein IJ224_04145 [Lachnospiraceae bacterium]|nr:hypothetical protein [Lachnospiraceae bacterium]